MGYISITVERKPQSDKSVIMKLEIFCELSNTDKLGITLRHLHDGCDKQRKAYVLHTLVRHGATWTLTAEVKH